LPAPHLLGPEPHLYDAAYRLDAGRFGLVLAPRDWHGSSPTVKDGKYTWPQKTPDSDNLFFDPASFCLQNKRREYIHPFTCKRALKTAHTLLSDSFLQVQKSTMT
jgi:hypothetical protein